MAIVLGVKGSEWAWQFRKFESVEQFKTVQKAWTKWGVIVLIINVILGVAYGVIMGIMAAKMGTQGYDFKQP